MVLTLCCVVLVFVACSEEPERGETDPEPRRTPARSAASNSAATEGTVASDYVEDEGVLSVEEAREEGDQIVVRAVVRGSADDRGCFLMEGPDWFALRRIIDSGAALPDSPRQVESLWAEELPADEFSGGDTYVAIFSGEDPDGGASPRETPFFAFCYKDAEPGGASGPTARYDVAHVEGTPTR